MVSVAVFSFLMLGIIAGLMMSYRLAAHTRYRDHARYILRSIGDQFMVQMAEKDSALEPMFAITTVPTGLGLSWQGYTPNTTTGVLNVPLGSPNYGQITDAVLTRDVHYLSDTGAVSATPPESTAGILLRGDFKITYNYNGKSIEQSLSLVRRVP